MSKSAQAFRTIREVADWLGVAAHVLRFWESKFTQIKPVKRAGGRRYYRPEDMALVGGIKVLLHDQGQTIRAVQRMIREQGTAHVAQLSPALPGSEDDIAADSPAQVEKPESTTNQAESSAAPEAQQEGQDDKTEQDETMSQPQPTPASPEPAVAQSEDPRHLCAADALSELAQLAQEIPRNRTTKKALRPHIARLEKLQTRMRAGARL